MTVRTPHVVKDDKHWLDPPGWWKKFKPLRLLAIGTIVIGFGSGLWKAGDIVLAPAEHPDTAHYTAGAAQAVSLGTVFNSYSSLASVTGQLDNAQASWTVRKNHRPPSSSYPPRDLDTVSVESYVHLGQPGRLTLEFFNNRLYEMDFEPQDPPAYSDALHKAEPRLKRDRIGKVEFVDGYLRVYSNVDLARSDVGRTLGTKPYAIWQDLRLVRQRDEWDAAFGSIPAPMHN